VSNLRSQREWIQRPPSASSVKSAHGQRWSVKRGDAVETVMQCSGDGMTVMTVAASRRWLRTLFEIGIRVCRWGLRLTANLVL